MTTTQSAAAEDVGALHDLATLALEQWRLDPIAIEPLKIRENAVFRVDLRDGGRVVLRIHRAGYHGDDALHAEFHWMDALAASGIEVPRVVNSKQGRPFESVSSVGVPEGRQIDVLEWVDGQQLGALESGLTGASEDIASRYRTLGGIAARMHNHTSQWSAPAGFVRHSWCEEGLAGAQPLWGRFWELEQLSAAQRAMFERARDAVWQDLSAFGKTREQFGLIHADLVPENVLVDGERLRVIDFDDAGFGWHLFDIATSLYFIRNDPGFDVALDAFVEGYRACRPLADADLRRLPLFMAARSTTYLGWVHNRKETETAKELTPLLIDYACSAVDEYLTGRAAMALA
ncbi:phosphotransferase enzyme family protein [Paraburkholderia saeva]|uniref:Stress response kinase A n=1 Tax=Paraburkholderia saeva TaxID=2777537 RepID=A0A9N8RZ74_9BURK|nr:phosphotransferase [Paraburkholderia saeva]CAG4904351.1 Stress response kinase A [Paraburkholderia saeva]CAG4910167.1 Stress response kinase A [Paraburkholderia saeva]